MTTTMSRLMGDNFHPLGDNQAVLFDSPTHKGTLYAHTRIYEHSTCMLSYVHVCTHTHTHITSALEYLWFMYKAGISSQGPFIRGRQLCSIVGRVVVQPFCYCVIHAHLSLDVGPFPCHSNHPLPHSQWLETILLKAVPHTACAIN